MDRLNYEKVNRLDLDENSSGVGDKTNELIEAVQGEIQKVKKIVQDFLEENNLTGHSFFTKNDPVVNRLMEITNQQMEFDNVDHHKQNIVDILNQKVHGWENIQ